MIKYSKNLFMNPAQIGISGINCSYNNVIKVVSIFEYKQIVLTIDSVTEESSLLIFIKKQGLKHTVKKSSINYIEISVVVPYKLFNIVLDKAISENPENIFMFNLMNPENWNEQLLYPFEKLVATGITNMFISVSFDENSMLISMHESLLLPREVYKKLKALQLE